MDGDDEIMEPTRWKKSGWIAQVQKNEDDDGWAVAMTRVGDSEPALVGPWTMGRDKRNPKPLDAGAFATLVKTASEVLRRHEAAAHEKLHKTLRFTADDGRRLVASFAIQPDDDDPHAVLTIRDEADDRVVRTGRVGTSWKLTAESAQKFARGASRE